MKPREKLLGGIVVVLLAAVGLRFIGTRVMNEFDLRQSQIAALEKKIKEQNLIVERGKRARRTLADLEMRSLPSDLSVGSTLYQHYLVDLCDSAGLRDVNVQSTVPTPHGGVYHSIQYSVAAKGSVEQFGRFMHDFYSTGHLDQVWQLTAKRVEKSDDLDLRMTIEALALPKTDRQDSLSSAPANRLTLPSWENYRGSIVPRNLFAEYTPPPPPRPNRPAEPPPPPRPPEFDVAQHAYVTAIILVGERPQVWLNVRTTGKLMKLFEGDPVEVGDYRGTVARIASQSVEFDLGGDKRQIVGLGSNLRQGNDVPAVSIRDDGI
jgi:hypothetical protein